MHSASYVGKNVKNKNFINALNFAGIITQHHLDCGAQGFAMAIQKPTGAAVTAAAQRRKRASHCMASTWEDHPACCSYSAGDALTLS